VPRIHRYRELVGRKIVPPPARYVQRLACPEHGCCEPVGRYPRVLIIQILGFKVYKAFRGSVRNRIEIANSLRTGHYTAFLTIKLEEDIVRVVIM
jgi:hypothetical protein